MLSAKPRTRARHNEISAGGDGGRGLLEQSQGPRSLSSVVKKKHRRPTSDALADERECVGPVTLGPTTGAIMLRKILMMFDDEVLKRYGLPLSIVERALIKAYETVALDWDHS